MDLHAAMLAQAELLEAQAEALAAQARVLRAQIRASVNGAAPVGPAVSEHTDPSIAAPCSHPASAHVVITALDRPDETRCRACGEIVGESRPGPIVRGEGSQRG